MSEFSYKNHVKQLHSKKRQCKICGDAFDLLKEFISLNTVKNIVEIKYVYDTFNA